MNVLIGSGYFDPIHPGHIEYIQAIVKATKLHGGIFYIIVNNDHQASLKKGKPFMNQNDRMTVVSSLEGVRPENVILSIDEDGSVSKTIEYIAKVLKPMRSATNRYVDNIYFVKGGDRKADEIPESVICKAMNVVILDKGYGEKIRHSSVYIDGNDKGTK